MLIKTLTVGQIETNCYVVTDENTLECAVIDPGDESNVILNYLEEHKLKAKYIFLTHGHFDHTMAVEAVQEETGATVCMSRKDVGQGDYRYDPGDGAVMYGEDDIFHVGGLTFRVMETPGHTPAGCVLSARTPFSPATLSSGTPAAARTCPAEIWTRCCTASSGFTSCPAITRSIPATWTPPPWTGSAVSTTT